MAYELPITSDGTPFMSKKAWFFALMWATTFGLLIVSALLTTPCPVNEMAAWCEAHACELCGRVPNVTIPA